MATSTFPVSSSFSASNTIDATGNTMDITFTVCGGYSAYFSSCNADGGSASGSYNIIRLFDGMNAEVASGGIVINGGSCSSGGFGAFFAYSFPGAADACQTYRLAQGCSGSDACAGTVKISVTGALPKPHHNIPHHTTDR